MEVEQKHYTSGVNTELLLKRLISVVYQRTKCWRNSWSASQYKSLAVVVWFGYKSEFAHLCCRAFRGS